MLMMRRLMRDLVPLPLAADAHDARANAGHRFSCSDS